MGAKVVSQYAPLGECLLSFGHALATVTPLRRNSPIGSRKWARRRARTARIVFAGLASPIPSDQQIANKHRLIEPLLLVGARVS